MSRSQNAMNVPDLPKNVAGGSATERGMDFQARVSAIAMANLLAERSLGWLDGVLQDIPVEITAETRGPGDDIGLRTQSGQRIEIQVKRGLSAGGDLWDALLALAAGVSDGRIAAGVLAVCPNSTGTIRNALCGDIVHMGTGRFDGLHDLGKAFLTRLKEASLDAEQVCCAIRIVTVPAVGGNREAEINAVEKLARITLDAERAWRALVTYARRMIEIRGRATGSSLLHELDLREVTVKTDTIETLVQLQATLRGWIEKTYSEITILGVSRPVSLRLCWIPLKATILSEVHPAAEQLEMALSQYHEYAAGKKHRDNEVDAITFGRYVRRAVVLGGPGIGKSTLLKRLAIDYAGDGHLVLYVSLPRVASLLSTTGQRFEKCLIEVALSSSGLVAGSIALDEAVLLCDGLDECGTQMARITEALNAFSAGHPRARILVSSRPIGYQAGHLGAWRHYELRPLEESEVEKALSTVIGAIPLASEGKRKAALELVKKQVNADYFKGISARSPLMLTLIAALTAKGIEPDTTRTMLYRQLFEMIEEHPHGRVQDAPPSAPERNRFLELLGWSLLEHGNTPAQETFDRCVRWWMDEAQKGRLASQIKVQECFAYWEALGVVERVRTASQEALTFVHKTFGEFAAGRYMSNCKAEVKAQLISKAIVTASWRESLAFASHLGMADLILLEWSRLASDGDYEASFRLDDALEFVIDSGAPLTESALASFVDCCWKVAANEVSRTRYAGGDALCMLAKSSWSAIREKVFAGLDADDGWFSVLAWACLCASPEKEIPYDRLLRYLRNFDHRWIKPTRLRGYVLQSNGHETQRCFMAGVAKRILSVTTSSSGLEELNALIEGSDWMTVRTVIDLGTIYKEADIALPKKLRWDMPGLAGQYWSPKTHRVDLSAFYETIDDPSMNVEPETCGEGSELELGAFFAASKLWQMPASVFSEFTLPEDLKKKGRRVVHDLVRAAGIELPRLVLQARSTLRRLSTDDFSTYFGLLHVLHVDVEIEFDRLSIKAERVSDYEDVVLRGGQFFGYCAAAILKSQKDQAWYASMASRMMQLASGTALLYAVGLALELPAAECQALLLKRITANPQDPGCSFIYPKLTPPFTEVHEDVVLQTLAGSHAYLAETAAELVLRMSMSSKFLLGLCRHYEEWKTKEEPYPDDGGTVPPTPRDELAKILVRAFPADTTLLLSMAQDVRPDVREACEEELISGLAGASSLCDEFLRLVDGGQIRSSFLSKAITAGVFDGKRGKLIVQFLRHPSAKVRFDAISILSQKALPDEQVLDEATRLLRDEEFEIKESAGRILKELHARAG